jgi:hypothetical protein
VGRGRKATKAAADAAGAATGAAKAADAGSLPEWASGLTPVQYGAVLKGAQAYGLEPEAFLDLRNRARDAGATSEDFKKGRRHLMTVIAQSEPPVPNRPGNTPVYNPLLARADGSRVISEELVPEADKAAAELGRPRAPTAAEASAGTPSRDEMLGFLLRPVEQGGAGFTEAQIGGFNDAEIADTYNQVKPVVDKAGAKRGGKRPPAQDITSNVASDPASRPPSGENDTLPSTEGAVEAATKQASGKRGPGRPRKNPQAAAPAPAAKPAAAATTAKPNPADFSTVNWNQFQSGVRPNNPGDWSNLKAADFKKALDSGSPNPTPGAPPPPGGDGGGGRTPPTEKPSPWHEQAGWNKPFLQTAAEHAWRNLPDYITISALGYGGTRLLNSGGQQQNEQAMQQAMPVDMADEFLRQRGLMPPLQPNPADYGPSPEDRIRQMRGQ